MLELHYLVTTAGGHLSEKVLRCSTYEDFREAVTKCKKYGYTVLKNPMCLDCKKNGQGCDGSVNYVWTGCAQKEKAG